jgi:hypothetical protein
VLQKDPRGIYIVHVLTYEHLVTVREIQVRACFTIVRFSSLGHILQRLEQAFFMVSSPVLSIYGDFAVGLGLLRGRVDGGRRRIDVLAAFRLCDFPDSEARKACVERVCPGSQCSVGSGGSSEGMRTVMFHIVGGLGGREHSCTACRVHRSSNSQTETPSL